MAVGFYDNWGNIFDKIENLMRTEFGNGLKIYKLIGGDIKDNQYLKMFPVGSNNIAYHTSVERREYNINFELHYKDSMIQKSDTDQIMRYVSRMEAVVENNSSMALSDGTDAYDCRIESTEIDNENDDEYVVTMDFRCVHTNDITSDTTSPTMTITATEVVDGATSYHTTLAMTFTSSENTTDFAVTDITLGNAVLSSFSATSGTVYTATLTPSAAGAVTVDVNAERYIDNAGNPNTAATQFNWTYAINTYSLEFDGNNDYVQIDADPLGTNYNACTYSAWIKTDSEVTGTIINRTSNTSNSALLSFKILGN